MRTLADYAAWLRSLDDLSRRGAGAPGAHPAMAITVAVCFLIAVMSFDRYSPLALAPLALYPIVMFALSGAPAAAVIRPLLLVEPLVLCVGILNPWLDTAPATVAGVTFARGWLSLLSLAAKCALAVSAGILLAARLGMERLAAGLRALGMPRSFVLQLLLTYRYIWVLLDEAGRVSLAYAVRSGRSGGARLGDWGALAGGLLLRTYGRAENIHRAMLLRGFDGEFRAARLPPPCWRDWAYAAGWIAFFAAARLGDLTLLAGKPLTEALFP